MRESRGGGVCVGEHLLHSVHISVWVIGVGEGGGEVVFVCVCGGGGDGGDCPGPSTINTTQPTPILSSSGVLFLVLFFCTVCIPAVSQYYQATYCMHFSYAMWPYKDDLMCNI